MNLDEYIQPQHLTDEAIAQFKMINSEDYLNGIIIDDFIHTNIIESIQPVIYKEAKYKEYYRLYSKKRFVTEDEWYNADEKDRLFRLNYVCGVKPEFTDGNNWLTFTNLRRFFVKGFPVFFYTISGTSLTRTGVLTHAITHKDFLKVHSDVDKNRDLSTVFYLTLGWNPNDGGSLHMLCRNNKEINKIDYVCNRLVIFTPSRNTNHYVGMHSDKSKDKVRVALVTWYKLSDS